jgi:preprotein translocase subunit YajC
MEINYLIIAIVVVIAIWLIIFMIRRNQKDKKNFEKQFAQSELKPDKHQDEREKL